MTGTDSGFGSYGAELSAAWDQHLAPPGPGAPTVISTFAGCGGSSLGYSMAGYRELLAVEYDRHATETFIRNLPDVPVFPDDIAALDPASVEMPPGGLDVLDGSPPCQGFSLSGNRQLDDDRNQLFRQYVRLLDAWTPKVFVMENVAAMAYGKMRLLFAEILTALKHAGPGYRVIARRLNTAYYRVPQDRHRMIFVGVRADLDTDPVHPVPTSPAMTVREALADLDGPGDVVPLRGKAAFLAPRLAPGQAGGQYLTRHGRRMAFYNLRRLHPDRPAVTIVRSIRPYLSGLIHPAENRLLGTRELARLQSFPDPYDWGTSTYEQVHARIGNSVPPLFMRAIATTVREQILPTVVRS